jgi:hypothetical protein
MKTELKNRIQTIQGKNGQNLPKPKPKACQNHVKTGKKT